MPASAGSFLAEGSPKIPAVLAFDPLFPGRLPLQKRVGDPYSTQLFKADLLTFWFSLFGLFSVEVPKGDRLL